MPSRIAVIINAAAGGGYTPAQAKQLAERFRNDGVEAHITLAQSGAAVADAARHAVTQRVQAVVAGGGDGTVNAVASALADTGIALGVLPLGTLNHFAKDAGIPLAPEGAVGTIVAGHSVLVDIGEVNDRIFINNSSLGIYPDIVREREKQQRRFGRSKWLAFGWGAMTALRRYPFLHVRLRVNGSVHEHHTPFVFIGNNEYSMEGFSIGERRSLQRGQLSLYAVHRTGRLGLMRIALRALFGRLRQARDFDMLVTNEISVETRRRRIRVALDGEVTIMDTPLHYRVRPAALRVLVPAPAAAAAAQ